MSKSDNFDSMLKADHPISSINKPSSTRPDSDNTYSKTKKNSFFSQTSSIQLLSGCLSGLITCFLFQPFDLIKTRQQQQQKLLPLGSGKALLNEAAQNKLSIHALVKQILKQDGALGLWRGTVPTVLRNVPGMGLYFLSFEKLKVGLSLFKTSKPTRFEQLVCGATARSLVGFILMPISVIKVRIESNLYPGDTSIRKASRSVFHSHGVKGFFAGAGATIMRDAPYAGLYIYFYQFGKGLLNTSPDSPKILSNLSAGVVAGFAATLVTHPFDVIKTRMQLDKTSYPSLLTTLKSLAGPDLGRGLVMRLTRKSLSSAISWAGYEQFVFWTNSLLHSK